MGGVLFTNGTKQFILDISQRYQLDPKVVLDVLDGQIGSQYREAKITRDEFWKLIIEKLGLTEDIDVLETEWIRGYELIEGTKEIILELRKKYKVYYLSDNVRERVEKINDRYGFINWFDGGIFSHEAGVRKPSPQIYQLALEKAQVEPEEAIFIDDKESCLAPAKALGMTTFLFETPEKLKEELKYAVTINI